MPNKLWHHMETNFWWALTTRRVFCWGRILVELQFWCINICMKSVTSSRMLQQPNLWVGGEKCDVWGVNWAISASNQKRCVIAMVCKIVTDCLMAAKMGNQFTTVLERGRFIVVLICNHNCPASDGCQRFWHEEGLKTILSISQLGIRICDTKGKHTWNSLIVWRVVKYLQ